ncbi:DoxX family protein [Rhizobium sp. PAMB 3174]
MTILQTLTRLYADIFSSIERALDGWFLGLAARLVFLAVLYLYFLNSALTKVGDGLLGLVRLSAGAYYQIVPQAVDAAGGDVDAIGFLPWGLIVHLGTYAEFVLPALIVAGLFTRAAALGMIGFIAVQTLVDITLHMVDAETIGALFDRFPDSVIADQRLLWVFPLAYLAIKGAGLVSLDALLWHRCRPVAAIAA